MSNLNSFLEPRSIAIIGASRDRAKPGNLILRNIVSGGFDGQIFPVNPAGGEIEGYQVFSDVSEVPEPVDLAILVVGRAHVEPALTRCIEADVKSAVVVTAGFGEGDQMGRETQARMRELATASGMVAIGPNTIGYVNAEAKLFASFVNFSTWTDGSVAVVAQSGIYAGAVVHEIMAKPHQRLGLKMSIDIGNKLGLSELQLLNELAAHDEIGVLGFYLEEFEDVDQFMARAAEINRHKPVVVLKSGRTPEGARASHAHTGSIAMDDQYLDDLFDKHGLVRAQDSEEFMTLLRTFEYAPAPSGRRVGIVTYSGALGIMAADAVRHAGLELAEFSSVTSDALNELAPDWQDVGNPADLWSAAEGNARRAAEQCFSAIVDDETVDQALFVLLALPNVDFEGMRDVFADLRVRRPEVPIHVTLDGALREEWISRLEGLGVVVHDSLRGAARAMDVLATYADQQNSGRV